MAGGARSGVEGDRVERSRPGRVKEPPTQPITENPAETIPKLGGVPCWRFEEGPERKRNLNYP